MVEVVLSYNNSEDPLIREEHVNPNIANMPVVSLPACLDVEETFASSTVAYEMHQGNLTENWMLEAYARTTPAPLEALNFAGHQYLKYGMKVPPKNFLLEVFKYLIYFIDTVNSELLFHGLTDVVLSNDRYYYTYYKKSANGSLSTFPVTDIDIYTYFPAQKNNYEWLLRHPGLVSSESRPHEVEYIWEFLQENSSLSDQFSEHWEEYFGQYYKDVAHLGIWALLMWIISPTPEAEHWRRNAMDVYAITKDYGECLFQGGDIYLPDDYIKVNKPVGSCHVCGVKIPCAMMYTEGGVRGSSFYFCNAHKPTALSDAEMLYGHHNDWECPTCTFYDCPHNSGTKLQIAPHGKGHILRTGLRKFNESVINI